ncbi:DUF4145 domain-containing protein [Hoeflea alexandrii]|uniref:DUF4145 domain-containing protein n=1 Tax=Hoeflea alexandrii TaxID=288436 RepID=A0ABT1CPP2_9HYPH|nr:DUF4145 domain-containing protein [Hoeflea alexandrii]MCO6408177.1 DUF4145 domain-containing protein [Hoeflea alexandrii]MCY0153506.1 DUF4145 domain-containing protein [Hoeflea alexandrii]
MAIIIGDCPRCGAKHSTFDVNSLLLTGVQYGWQKWFECFSVCRNCNRSTILVISGDVDGDRALRDLNPLDFKVSINNGYKIEGHVSLKDRHKQSTPLHLPKDIAGTFSEAATCMSVRCWNAAGTMFRLCIDLATRQLLPSDEVNGLNSKTRRDLGLRLPWLFDNGKLPNDLRDLSSCIHQDGNDAAHTGKLSQVDAEDLLDFTVELLERVFSEPERLKLAAKRRADRRKPE